MGINDLKSSVEVPKYLEGRPRFGGYIVPYFVCWYLGREPVHERTPGAVPSFQTVDAVRAIHCRRQRLCWICGKQIGTYKWFVFGPAGVVAQQSVEPPSHMDCAHYAVQVCPFMLNPNKHIRVNRPLRESEQVTPDLSTHNPGVSVLWVTKTFLPVPIDPKNGVYRYDVGEPEMIEYWREGRKATRAEIKAAFNLSLAQNNLDPRDIEIAWRIEKAMRFAPEE